LKKLIYLVVLLFLLPPSVSWAKHIVGGEITYIVKQKQLSSNTYVFTMRIFRDCRPQSEAADFDTRASIGLFLQKSGRRLGDIFAPVGIKRRIGNPDYPCLKVPDNLCVEEGVYTWEMTLDNIDDTYILMYSRCCRNNTISNIVRPGDVGASYTVEISPLAQEVGSNSPSFKQFPPTVICNQEPLKFDHSATDAEGDQLVYRFCQPLPGGSPVGDLECTGTRPTPPCYPPDGTLTFKGPDYSFSNPMGGDPQIKIDPNTGLITGTPFIKGQYVVGICVEEYRNGRLLSVIRRDFQFNVESCRPTVRGGIAADSIDLVEKQYYIFSCGQKTIDVENKSFERGNITDFRYDLNLKGINKTYTDWEPKVVFPDTGIYKGKLFLNPGTICADTINLVFNIFNSISTDFSFHYDTCVAGPVTFKDKSVSQNGNITSWKWSFGDGRDTTVQNPIYQYLKPGLKPIKLTVKDTRGCTSDTSKSFGWYPVPPLVVVQPSTFNGCTPAKINFTNLSLPIDSTYTVNWSFGDGGTSKAISPSYEYKNQGTYNVSVNITSPIGCKVSQNYTNWIKVSQGSTAGFDYTPQTVTSFNKSVTFFDRSKFATRWQWYIGNDAYSTKQNPVHTFKDTGVYKVLQVVSNQFGCVDSLIKYIDVEPQVTYWLPNAFSPNNDGNNDTYKGLGFIGGMKDFRMQIYNRWGELIFETTNPTEGWNGLKYNKGDDLPQGVYLCIVSYISPRGESRQLRNYATLIR
jgi:gliding motility-associated-like protein